jgi:hypothetical protein
MIWPFRKSTAPPRPATLHFKSGAVFFEHQCKFGHTTIEPGTGVIALVLDAQKEFGTTTAVSIGADGAQLAALKVASDDGGFLVFAKTPSEKGDKLQADDLVLWVPSIYSEEVGHKVTDRRTGWVGLIRAKIKPEIQTDDPSFVFVCRYD